MKTRLPSLLRMVIDVSKALARVLLARGKVSEALEEARAARAVLVEAANEIRRKAETITDVDVPQIYLAIPEHVQTFALEKEWDGAVVADSG